MFLCQRVAESDIFVLNSKEYGHDILSVKYSYNYLFWFIKGKSGLNLHCFGIYYILLQLSTIKLADIFRLQ